MDRVKKTFNLSGTTLAMLLAEMARMEATADEVIAGGIIAVAMLDGRIDSLAPAISRKVTRDDIRWSPGN